MGRTGSAKIFSVLPVSLQQSGFPAFLVCENLRLSCDVISSEECSKLVASPKKNLQGWLRLSLLVCPLSLVPEHIQTWTKQAGSHTRPRVSFPRILSGSSGAEKWVSPLEGSLKSLQSPSSVKTVGVLLLFPVALRNSSL